MEEVGEEPEIPEEDVGEQPEMEEQPTPGPQDRPLLTSFDTHIAGYIWNQQVCFMSRLIYLLISSIIYQLLNAGSRST